MKERGVGTPGEWAKLNGFQRGLKVSPGFPEEENKNKGLTEPPSGQSSL